VRSKTDVRESTLSTTAHELQHLINHSRRIHVLHAPADTVWLDEGLSHIAEELVYYSESGRAPRQNLAQAQILANAQQLAAFNEYQIQNTGRYEEYLRNPAPNSPWAGDDELETRGATWSLLRYAADRRNGNDQTFWFALVNSTNVGIPNLAAALGTDPVAFARDWAVSNYTDDAVPGVAPQFTQPSWNYRDIFRNSGLGGVYPLSVQPLANGSTSLTVRGGSAGYLKFAVAAGQQADVRVAQSGTTVGGACTVLNMAVGQVQQTVMNSGTAMCPTGGAGGAEYVLIPFYGSTEDKSTIALGITASNVGTAVGPPNPSRSTADVVSGFPLDRLSIWHPYDGGLERRIRLRGQQITQRLQNTVARGARRSVSGVEGPSGVTVNLVRTK
jgi:hypothetical protein